MLNIISLGAGVQSSTMALMAAHGEITPMPDCAIFADTGWEPKSVYNWLNWLEKQLPFPTHRCSVGNIRSDLIERSRPGGKERRFASVPFYTSSGGMGMRQCTADYKLTPLHRKCRELLNAPRPEKGAISLWIGISTDEAQRMKPARQQYLAHRWPLVESGVSRLDCLKWMKVKGYDAPPKSSCLGCPYHDDKQWAEIKSRPEEWADVLEVDKAIRDPGHGLVDQQFMHRSRKPLDQVDFRTAEDAGQMSMFGNECEGMCGV